MVGTAFGIDYGGEPIPKLPGEYALGTKPRHHDVTTRLSRLNLLIKEWLRTTRYYKRFRGFTAIRTIGFIFRNVRQFTNPVGAFAAAYVLGMVPTVAYLAEERARK